MSTKGKFIRFSLMLVFLLMMSGCFGSSNTPATPGAKAIITASVSDQITGASKIAGVLTVGAKTYTAETPVPTVKSIHSKAKVISTVPVSLEFSGVNSGNGTLVVKAVDVAGNILYKSEPVSIVIPAPAGTAPITITAPPITLDTAIMIPIGTAKLDGYLGDFKGPGYHINSSMITDVPTVDNDSDCSATAYAMYDSSYFYIGFDVTDESVVMNATSVDGFWNVDCVEFNLGDRQYLVSCLDGNDIPSLWDTSGDPPASFDGVYRRTAAGYVIEARISTAQMNRTGHITIPWAGIDREIPAITFTSGKTVKFALSVDDRDSGVREGQLGFPNGVAWHALEKFADAKFQ